MKTGMKTVLFGLLMSTIAFTGCKKEQLEPELKEEVKTHVNTRASNAIILKSRSKIGQRPKKHYLTVETGLTTKDGTKIASVSVDFSEGGTPFSETVQLIRIRQRPDLLTAEWKTNINGDLKVSVVGESFVAIVRAYSEEGKLIHEEKRNFVIESKKQEKELVTDISMLKDPKSGTYTVAVSVKNDKSITGTNKMEAITLIFSPNTKAQTITADLKLVKGSGSGISTYHASGIDFSINPNGTDYMATAMYGDILIGGMDLENFDD